MTDYAYWKAALEGKQNENDLKYGVAECGYWRKPQKDGSFCSVVVWRDDVHGLVASVNGRNVKADDLFVERIFSWAVKHPVTEEAFYKFQESGRWPDEAPVLSVPPSNFPEDPFEQLKLELEAERDELKRFLKDPITTQEKADQANSWANRLSENGKKAEGFRTEEKKPFLEGGRQVDAKWTPISGGYSELVRLVKNAITPFLREKQKKRQEEAAKAAREASINEPITPAAKAKAGNFGRSTSLRTFKQVEIVDYPALLEAIKDLPQIKEAAQKVAEKLVLQAGGKLPGVKIIETQRAV